MKRFKLKWTPALTAAVLLAILWCAGWPILLHIQPPPPPKIVSAPDVRYLPWSDDALYALLRPDRFARPSTEGFSGSFPPENIRRPERREQKTELSVSRPEPSPAAESRAAVDAEALNAQVPRLPPRQNTPALIAPPVPQTLFSPELAARLDQFPELNLTELPARVRAYLTIEPDGIVSRILFEPAVQNTELLRALRRLRFAPADAVMHGTFDIYNPAAETAP